MSEEEKTEEEETPKGPEWEKRRPVITEHMKEVCKATIGATEKEIASLRRKLDKLQYRG
jgi:hypothetical protein